MFYRYQEQKQFVNAESQWYWEFNGQYKPYSQQISQKLDNLRIGQIYSTKFGSHHYEITKLSATQCQQTNLSTNRTRNVILQQNDTFNVPQQNDGHQHRDDNKNNYDESEEKQELINLVNKCVLCGCTIYHFLTL